MWSSEHWLGWVNWVIGLVVVATLAVVYCSSRVIPPPTEEDEREITEYARREITRRSGRPVSVDLMSARTESDYRVAGSFLVTGLVMGPAYFDVEHFDGREGVIHAR